MLCRQGIINQLLVSLIVEVRRLPVLKIQQGALHHGLSTQEQLLVSLVVIQLFRIAHHHGIGKALQEIVHRHLALGSQDLRLECFIFQHSIRNGFLINSFFINPVFQEGQLFAIAPGVPFWGNAANIRFTELGIPHRNDNRIFFNKRNIASRQQGKRYKAKCTNSTPKQFHQPKNRKTRLTGLELEIQERVIALRKESKDRNNKNSKHHSNSCRREIVAPVVAAETPERKHEG